MEDRCSATMKQTAITMAQCNEERSVVPAASSRLPASNQRISSVPTPSSSSSGTSATDSSRE